MRSIRHPGPVIEPAVLALPAQLRTVRTRIEAGSTLLEGFAGLLRQYACQSAVARLGKSSLWPVVYVLPALSRSPEHAVYYSDRHVPDAPLALETGAVTIGLKGDELWLHCHASWYDADGFWHCGHLLPDETVLDAPMEVELTLLGGAGFVVCQDVHTNFSLFKPRELAEMPRSSNHSDSLNSTGTTAASVSHCGETSEIQAGWCLRIAPNVDLCEAIETFCRDNNLRQAQVLGGVGSTVGAMFDDGRVVDPFVTELMIEKGLVTSDLMRNETDQMASRECVVAQLDVALIDYQGGVHRGRLSRGENPVLVTCELVIAELR
ncbi:PCC domain-containing protein [Orrella marina]|uniref:PPC domain-containing protein n=1 Tax=Orrella marina TaxID=2163011 RepID=A0A2R4XIB2_9BURK|nr:DUF296 domain-containing protein [Orrella marina]AWB33474.1 hypothetical protein DBV39_06870 [Orrella marina]